MSRETLVQLTRRSLEHARNGTVPQAPGIGTVPAANYTDPARWELEMDRIFRRVPLVLGFSADLREPGDYVALEAAGVPVLLVRSADGVARSFVNMCRHRGAQIMDEGAGSARRFTCPYHAWSYGTDGALVGILDRAEFGDVDTDCNGLIPLPLDERAGILFGSVTPGRELHLDAWLAGYGDMLEMHGFADCQVVGRQRIAGPNWKVAYDGYLDLYHLPILHKNTFGPDYSNKAIYDAWGPHQRVSSPDHRILAFDELDEDDWPVAKMTGGVWTIFPHVSVASFDAGGKLYMISQLFPGATFDSSFTVQHFLATFEPDEEGMETIRKQMDFLLGVVRDEDYHTGLRLQKALATGALDRVMFGRNEAGGQRFHGWVEDLIATDDADYPALLDRAEVVFQP